MTDELIELGKRAVACKGFRWMPGMATDSKFVRVVAVDSDTNKPCGAENGATNDDCHAVWLDGVHLLPDLTDPATLGCLLALVREAYRDTSKLWDGYVEVQRDHQSLFFVKQFQHDADGFLKEIHRSTGRTEAEALVAALEAAP